MKRIISILIIFLFIPVIHCQPFLEDFDAVMPPALPAGWSSFSLFGGNAHPCTGLSDDWVIIDETAFAGCLPDPVTTLASSSPNFAFIGAIEIIAPGVVEDVLLTPVLMGLLSKETYDIKFKLRRTDLSPMPTTSPVKTWFL